MSSNVPTLHGISVVQNFQSEEKTPAFISWLLSASVYTALKEREGRPNLVAIVREEGRRDPKSG